VFDSNRRFRFELAFSIQTGVFDSNWRFRFKLAFSIQTGVFDSLSPNNRKIETKMQLVALFTLMLDNL
jgi:hypothetical protein